MVRKFIFQKSGFNSTLEKKYSTFSKTLFLIICFIMAFVSNTSSQNSCTQVTSFSYTSASNGAGACNYNVSINFFNPTGSNKGIKYWVMFTYPGGSPVSELGPICYVTTGGSTTTQSHTITNRPCGATISIDYIGYTASNGNCTGGDCTGGVASTVLPIVLEHFDVTMKNKNVLLTWATLSEINNEYFLVEKSYDGKSWETIAKVNGSGNSTSRNPYAIETENILKSAYFRLKQVDYDGKYSYSDVIFLNVVRSKTLDIRNVVSNRNEIKLSLDGCSESEFLVQISNGMGNIIESKLVNNNTDVLEIELNNRSFSPGIYFLSVLSGNQKATKKIIIF